MEGDTIGRFLHHIIPNNGDQHEENLLNKSDELNKIRQGTEIARDYLDAKWCEVENAVRNLNENNKDNPQNVDGSSQSNAASNEGNGDSSRLGKEVDEGDAFGSNKPTYGNVIGRMPTTRFATHYKMDHRSRGLALIFNHEVFHPSTNLLRRNGTNNDRKNLEAIFKEMGFDVLVYQDLRYSDIEFHVNQIAKHNHTHYDCLCITILTHGDAGILYAADLPYKHEDLWSKFTADRCPSLAGKPKIFLFQACQGAKLDPGITMSTTETDGQPVASYRIPTHADFLMVYSTVKGFYSWRNTTRGSWFIQALCDELKEKAFEYDFVSILTFVSQKVAYEYESNTPDNPTMHRQKQIPCIMSMLTRMIQFTKPAVGSQADNKIIHKEGKAKSVLKGIFQKM